MKKNVFYGVMLFVAFFMCGASFASPYTDTGLYAEPTSNVGFVFAVDPPLVPAMAMATGDNVDENDPKYCMASCRTDKRTSISVNFYQLNINNQIPKTILACGSTSDLDETPAKIPIAI